MNDNTRRIYDFLVAFVSQYGRSPSYAEVAEGVGLAQSTVHTHLNILRDRGFIRLSRYRWRSIELTEKAWR